MKTKHLILATFFLLTFFAKAAVITVSNHPNSPGQYNDLQTAIDAAAPNDILYVHGSATNYGNVTITKPLVLIGGGVLPQTNLQLPTTILSLTFAYNADASSNPSGSSVTGFNVLIQIYFEPFEPMPGTPLGISNITLKRNRIESIRTNSGVVSFNNFIIQNNIIKYLNTDVLVFKTSNTIISNNIISFIYKIQPGTGGSTLINNNIILTNMKDNKQCFFSNNFFLMHPTATNNNLNNSFTNNIFYNSQSATTFNQTSFETTPNTFSGNLYNQDPNFLQFSQELFEYTYGSPSAVPFINYNLATTSPGKNYGTDGTDVGIHGGATPFVQGTTTDSRFRYFPQPAIPQMMEMNILNNAIPQNGTLNVNFTATKND